MGSLAAITSAFQIDNDTNVGIGIQPTTKVRLTVNNGDTTYWKTAIFRANNGGNHLTVGTYQLNNSNNCFIGAINSTTFDTFTDLYINHLGYDNQLARHIGNVIINGKTTIGNNSNNSNLTHTLDVFSKNSSNIAIFRNSNLNLNISATSNIQLSTTNNSLNINSRTFVSDFLSINSNNFIPTSNERLVVNGIAVFNSNIIINGRIGGAFILDSDTSFSERNKVPANILNTRANSGLSSNNNNELFLNIDTNSGLTLNNNVIGLNPIIPNIQTFGKIIIGNSPNDIANFSFYSSNKSKFNDNVIIGSNLTSSSLNINDYVLNINGNLGITGNIFNASDSNLKTNIQPLNNSLNKISKCRGVSFNFKDNHKKNVGVVAQEIEEIFPEIVETTLSGIKNVNYNGLIGILIEAIKELNKKINDND